MKTQKIQTRFMDANKTDEVFDLLSDYYGMAAVTKDEIDYCEALFSNGFIRAIEQDGLVPVLGSQLPSFHSKSDLEYHHLIFNDECYCVYFKEM